jgi:hypothetical protein
MWTGSFQNCGHLTNAVGISGRVPVDFHVRDEETEWYAAEHSFFKRGGRYLRKLAPKYWIWADYQINHNTGLYTTRYEAEVLEKMDPEALVAELGTDAILCCLEPPGRFCHRRVVADWLHSRLGITVLEYLPLRAPT